MAKRGVINEFFDLAELEKQKELAKAAIADYIKSVESAKPIRIQLQGAESIRGVNEATQKLSEANDKAATAGKKVVDISKKIEEQTKKANKAIQDQATETANLSDTYKDLLELSVKNELAQKQLAAAKKELNDAFKAGNITEAEYIKSLAEVKDAQIAVGISQQEVTKTLKNIEKGAQAAQGSLEQMKAQLLLMQQVLSKLNDEERNSEIGKELTKQAKQLADAVNEQKKKMGDFSSNVGRYAESLAHGFEMVTREIARLQKAADDLEIRGDTRGAEQARKAIDELNGVIKISHNTNASYAQTVGAINKEFINMAAAGNQSKEFLEAFQKFAVESKKEAEDLRKEIKRLGSDTRQLDDLVGTISLLASTYELAAGAAALFGADNEDLERTIKKIVAVQSVANGIREIAAQITEKGTVANRIYAFTQSQIAIAFDKSAASAARFQAALGLIGIAITVIGVLVTLMVSFNKALFEGAEHTEKLNDKLNDLEYQSEKAKKALEDLEAQTAFLERLSDINIDISITSDFDKTLVRLRERSIQLTSDIYDIGETSKGAFARSQEASKTFFDEASRDAKELLGTYNDFDLIPKEKFDKLDEMDQKLIESAKARAKDYNDFILKQDAKRQEQSIIYAQIRLAKIEEERRQNKEIAEGILEDMRAERKAAFDLFKYRQGLLIEEQKARVVVFDGKDRAVARNKQASLEKELIQRTASFELDAAINLQSDLKVVLNKGLITEEDYQAELRKIHQLTASEQLYIRVKLHNDLTNLDFERLNDVKRFAIMEQQILLNEANKTSELLAELGRKQTEDEKRRQEQQDQYRIDDLSQSFVRQQRVAELTTAEELKALSERFAAGLIKKDEYEKQKLAIENDARKASILAEIAYYEALLKLAASQNISSEKQKEIIQALHDLKIKLLGVEASKNEENASKQLVQAEKMKESLLNLSTELTGLTFDIFTNALERQKNLIQDQIDLIEERKQKDIEAATQAITNEQQRADAIAVINARAAAQKEQLVIRQRIIDQQRARFEKAQNIASIIQSTSIAVVNALGSKPWTPANIALAAVVGAIGAAQVARVIATPIPRYFRGRNENDPYEGPAWVDDGGRPEAIVRKTGEWEIGGKKPRITWLNKGDRVLPDARKALVNAMHANQEKDSRIDVRMVDTSVELRKEMKDGFHYLGNIIEKKKEIHFQKPSNMDRLRLVKKGNREYYKMNGFDVD